MLLPLSATSQLLQLLPQTQLLLTSSVQLIMDRSWGLHLHSVQHHGTTLTVHHYREEQVWVSIQQQQQLQKRRRHFGRFSNAEDRAAARSRDADPRIRTVRGGGGDDSGEGSMLDGDDDDGGEGEEDKEAEEMEDEGDEAQLIRLLRTHSLLAMR